MKTATRLLLEAAGHIRRFGLAQSDLGGPGKPCCAVGAIRVAAYGTVDRLTPPHTDPIALDDREVWRAMMALRTIIRPDIPMVQVRDPFSEIAFWNDHPHREGAQVVHALRLAAVVAA